MMDLFDVAEMDLLTALARLFLGSVGSALDATARVDTAVTSEAHSCVVFVYVVVDAASFESWKEEIVEKLV